MNAELIHCANHVDVYFAEDNEEVYCMSYHTLHDTDTWPHAAGFERTRNGRGVILAVKEHYQGPAALYLYRAPNPQQHLL